jgi:hypothetical protein
MNTSVGRIFNARRDVFVASGHAGFVKEAEQATEIVRDLLKSLVFQSRQGR